MVASLLVADFNKIKMNFYNDTKEILYNIYDKEINNLNDVLRIYKFFYVIFNKNVNSWNLKRDGGEVNNILFFDNYRFLCDFKKIKWALKYYIFGLKILCLFDVAILKTHDHLKYWNNKFNIFTKNYNISSFGGLEKYLEYQIKTEKEFINRNSYKYMSDYYLTFFNELFFIGEINENENINIKEIEIEHKNKNKNKNEIKEMKEKKRNYKKNENETENINNEEMFKKNLCKMCKYLKILPHGRLPLSVI